MARRQTPMGALARGLVAGLVGSYVQNLFFRATGKIAPAPVKSAFHPPEQEQRAETPTQTVARRTYEDLMHHGKLSAERKKKGAELVHYAFGTAWGGLYGLLGGTSRAAASLPGSLGFGAMVWEASDNLLLPSFKLAGKPKRYPLKTHVYAVAAHLVFGTTLWATFKALGGRKA